MALKKVFVVMGSDSDWKTLKRAKETLESFGVPVEARVVSAHRTPEDLGTFAKEAESSGAAVIIAGAGGAAHLPGMLASYTVLPVIGVPVLATALAGVDSLLSIVQMPKGIPVATVAIDGAENAALLAVRMLGISEPELQKQLRAYREKLATESRAKTANLI